MTVVTVHLKDGEIYAVQCLDYAGALTSNFPEFILEKVAILKMVESGTFVTGVMGSKVNPEYLILTVYPYQAKKLMKLTGEQNGADART